MCNNWPFPHKAKPFDLPQTAKPSEVPRDDKRFREYQKVVLELECQCRQHVSPSGGYFLIFREILIDLTVVRNKLKNGVRAISVKTKHPVEVIIAMYISKI